MNVARSDKPSARGIGPARSARRCGDVGAESVRGRQFGQQREQDRAGAGAEIGDAQADDRGRRRRATSPAPVRPPSRYPAAAPASRPRVAAAAPRIPSRRECARPARPRCRRCAYCASSAASAEVSCRLACAIMPVRSRSSAAPRRMRASSSASSLPADFNCAASVRRALSMLGPGCLSPMCLSCLPSWIGWRACLRQRTWSRLIDLVSGGTVKAMTAYDDQNIFAKILRGEIPCFKVYENDRAFAFLDIMPRSPGHTLVIPKAPARGILDIAADDFAEVARTGEADRDCGDEGVRRRGDHRPAVQRSRQRPGGVSPAHACHAGDGGH